MHRLRCSGIFHNLDKGNTEKGWPFHTEHWSWKYVYMWYICIIIDNNKVNTTVGPPLLPIKPLQKTPPLTNLRGVRTPGPPPPPPPLDPRLQYIHFVLQNVRLPSLLCSTCSGFIQTSYFNIYAPPPPWKRRGTLHIFALVGRYPLTLCNW